MLSCMYVFSGITSHLQLCPRDMLRVSDTLRLLPLFVCTFVGGQRPQPFNRIKIFCRILTEFDENMFTLGLLKGIKKIV